MVGARRPRMAARRFDILGIWDFAGIGRRQRMERSTGVPIRELRRRRIYLSRKDEVKKIASRVFHGWLLSLAGGSTIARLPYSLTMKKCRNSPTTRHFEDTLCAPHCEYGDIEFKVRTHLFLSVRFDPQTSSSSLSDISQTITSRTLRSPI